MALDFRKTAGAPRSCRSNCDHWRHVAAHKTKWPSGAEPVYLGQQMIVEAVSIPASGAPMTRRVKRNLVKRGAAGAQESFNLGYRFPDHDAGLAGVNLAL